MPGNADKHAPVLSILCCARRIHVAPTPCGLNSVGLGVGVRDGGHNGLGRGLWEAEDMVNSRPCMVVV